MDLRMPGVGGLEATARIRVEHPETAVIVLTMDSDDDSIFAALRAGARGYLLKEADGLDIERAIDGVARGEAVFGAGIAERVLAFFASGRRPAAGPFPQLSPREHEVLELIAQGLDNAADRPAAGAAATRPSATGSATSSPSCTRATGPRWWRSRATPASAADVDRRRSRRWFRDGCCATSSTTGPGTLRHEPLLPRRVGRPTSPLKLEFPQSLAVYDDYAAAQKAVDFLADNKFPVEQCMIVGTDLKRIERITGRLSYGRVAAGGALSGLWLGLFVGLIFALFADRTSWRWCSSTVLFGAVFGLIWAIAGYAATRGQRDFSSTTQVVATRYEVLVEHKVGAQARELLGAAAGWVAGPVRLS